MAQVPLVDYLVLEPEPHLVAHECTSCGARFFDRRNACASCFGTEFRDRRRRHRRARCGRSRSCRSPRPASRCRSSPAVVDCDGTSVRANVINIDARPRARARRHEGPARDRRSVGTDSAGTEAIGFGFEPHRKEPSRWRDDIWILGIHMTKFGKHPDKDTVDLAAEAAMGALADGGVTMRDMGILAAGNLMGGGRADRPDAPEADRPDRHPRLQRRPTRARPARPRCAPRSWR